jgi:hypothetical protein
MRCAKVFFSYPFREVYLKKLNPLELQGDSWWVFVLWFSVQFSNFLAAPHTITAIQAFVAGAASYCNVPAGIAGRCITLHTLSCSIYGTQPCI